jgi:hypothetical protein
MVMIVRIYVPGVDYKKMPVMFQWCEQHFGEFRDRWNLRIIDGIWEFKNSGDATLFQLRWA